VCGRLQKSDCSVVYKRFISQTSVLIGTENVGLDYTTIIWCVLAGHWRLCPGTYIEQPQWRRNEFERGGGANVCRKAPINFLCRTLHFFGSTSTISRFGERFRDGQYSLVSFLFAVLLNGVPRAQPMSFVKVGARAPVPYAGGATGLTNEISEYFSLLHIW